MSDEPVDSAMVAHVADMHALAEETDALRDMGYCPTCGLPIPIESTPGPETALPPGEPIMCLLDHGRPSWWQRRAALRRFRRMHRSRPGRADL